MWDQDIETLNNIKKTYKSIIENNNKFNNFYKTQYPLSLNKYTSKNFNNSLTDEKLDGYICGSDTIWCIREFHGFDDGYYGNYQVMKNSRTISYAASFGDVDFTDNELKILNDRLQNFKAISVRESSHIDFIKEHVDVPVERVIDPTLLLKGDDYECITAKKQYDFPYILLYSRRYNAKMEAYAERIAAEMGCKIVEISIRAENEKKGHIMRYDAGVEEYLSLIKYAKFAVTNSFHGLIFSMQLHTPFVIFSREQADTKIDELLDLLQLKQTKMVTGEEQVEKTIDFETAERNIVVWRELSLKYLRTVLKTN